MIPAVSETAKIFSGMHFVLCGTIPKIGNKKYTQSSFEHIIQENGGRVKKNLPGELKGRSTKKYYLLHSRVLGKSVNNAVKKAIRLGYSVLDFTYILHSIEQKKRVDYNGYEVDTSCIRKFLTVQPSLTRKHFTREKSMLSMIKVPTRKKSVDYCVAGCKPIKVEKNAIFMQTA